MTGDKSTVAVEDSRPPRAFENLHHTCHRCKMFLGDSNMEIVKTDDPGILYFVHRGQCPPRAIEW